MRAAVVSEYGLRRRSANATSRRPPRAGSRRDARGRAQPGRPRDRIRAASPPEARRFPYVPGIEGVGTSSSPPASRRGRASGRRAAGSGSRATARSPSGSRSPTRCSSRFPRTPRTSSPPRSAQVGLAAWMSLSLARSGPPRRGRARARRDGQRRLRRGAGCEAARRGPGRRRRARRRTASRRAAALGADATVALDGDDFRERLAAAVDGAPPTLVLDLLWGPPLEAATAVAAPGARIAHLGQSAAPTATLASRARPREAAADPRLLELRRSARRARAGLRRSGRARGRGPDPPRHARRVPLGSRRGGVGRGRRSGRDVKLVLVP